MSRGLYFAFWSLACILCPFTSGRLRTGEASSTLSENLKGGRPQPPWHLTGVCAAATHVAARKRKARGRQGLHQAGHLVIQKAISLIRSSKLRPTPQTQVEREAHASEPKITWKPAKQRPKPHANTDQEFATPLFHRELTSQLPPLGSFIFPIKPRWRRGMRAGGQLPERSPSLWSNRLRFGLG